MAMRPLSVNQTVLSVTRAEALQVLQLYARKAVCADVVVYCHTREFALEAAHECGEGVKVSADRVAYARPGVEVVVLFGDHGQRICGRRHSLVVLVTDDGIWPAEIKQMTEAACHGALVLS
jgi:hypothetical protein